VTGGITRNGTGKGTIPHILHPFDSWANKSLQLLGIAAYNDSGAGGKTMTIGDWFGVGFGILSVAAAVNQAYAVCSRRRERRRNRRRNIYSDFASESSTTALVPRRADGRVILDLPRPVMDITRNPVRYISSKGSVWFWQ
jgi:hypothetical protein